MDAGVTRSGDPAATLPRQESRNARFDATGILD